MKMDRSNVRVGRMADAPENAARVQDALVAFGAPGDHLDEEALATEGTMCWREEL
jgi:hypothetical protein